MCEHSHIFESVTGDLQFYMLHMHFQSKQSAALK
jgi:hypothetical protein